MANVSSMVGSFYSKLQSASDLKTNVCKAGQAPQPAVKRVLQCVPDAISAKYFGCGNPFPVGIREGLQIVDLGSGSGRDCYVLAAMVGKKGSVVGIDMIPEQVELAQNHISEFSEKLGYDAQLQFKLGNVEEISKCGILNNSVDLFVSNCVINLCQDKQSVFVGVHQALKEGGELYFSDMYCDRRIDVALKAHEDLIGEGLAGALYIADFLSMCRTVGFSSPRRMSSNIIEVESSLQDRLGCSARFSSSTYRLCKCADFEPTEEDYGQTAKYLGTIETSPLSYILDENTIFPANKLLNVSGNTASMLKTFWLSSHFQVFGNQETHYGPFQ